MKPELRRTKQKFVGYSHASLIWEQSSGSVELWMIFAEGGAGANERKAFYHFSFSVEG